MSEILVQQKDKVIEMHMYGLSEEYIAAEFKVSIKEVLAFLLVLGYE